MTARAHQPSVETAEHEGYFLGVNGAGERVRSRAKRHLLCCGPSQTGKTESVLAHALLSVNGCMVTTSTKDDLAVRPTGAKPPAVLDLMDRVPTPGGMTTYRFSPLTLIQSFEDALRVGSVLMDTAFSFAKSGASNEAYWTNRGKRVVAALLWAAHLADLPIGTVFQWAAGQDHEGPLAVLPDADAAPRSIIEGLTVSDGKGGRRPTSQASAVWSFAEQAVAVYAYGSAAQRAERPNLDPDAFVRTSECLHIICPSTLAPELGPVIAVLLQSLVEARYRAHCAVPDLGRLTLVLDEVANTAPLPALPAILSEGAGQGVSAIVATQDRAQLIDRFGDAAHTIVNNCRDRLITAELGDRQFLDDIAALAGTVLRPEQSTTETASGHGTTRSITITSREQPVWSTSNLAQLKEYKALYLRGWIPHLLQLQRVPSSSLR